MKNFEKYENELLGIIEQENYFKFNNKKKVVSTCGGGTCMNCLFFHMTPSSCEKERMKWLFQECESNPLLTDKEREYLLGLLKPLPSRHITIVKRGSSLILNKYRYQLQVNVFTQYDDKTDLEIPHTFRFPYFLVESDMYQGLEPNKTYTAEELGLLSDENDTERERVINEKF